MNISSSHTQFTPKWHAKHLLSLMCLRGLSSPPPPERASAKQWSAQATQEGGCRWARGGGLIGVDNRRTLSAAYVCATCTCTCFLTFACVTHRDTHAVMAYKKHTMALIPQWLMLQCNSPVLGSNPGWGCGGGVHHIDLAPCDASHRSGWFSFLHIALQGLNCVYESHVLLTAVWLPFIFSPFQSFHTAIIVPCEHAEGFTATAAACAAKTGRPL